MASSGLISSIDGSTGNLSSGCYCFWGPRLGSPVWILGLIRLSYTWERWYAPSSLFIDVVLRLIANASRICRRLSLSSLATILASCQFGTWLLSTIWSVMADLWWSPDVEARVARVLTPLQCSVTSVVCSLSLVPNFLAVSPMYALSQFAQSMR